MSEHGTTTDECPSQSDDENSTPQRAVRQKGAPAGHQADVCDAVTEFHT